MKTIPALAFLVAFIAFLVFPFDFQTGISLLFGAGLTTMLVCDYVPHARRLNPALAASTRPERLRLAA
jgi:hypothetical protein